jgi:hypothetical protein
MANEIKGRPWVLDTAAATPVKPGTVFTTGFVFRNYTNGAASAATIKDGRRNLVITTLVGNANNTPVGEAWFQNQPIDELILSAIDSGVVEVIVK